MKADYKILLRQEVLKFYDECLGGHSTLDSTKETELGRCLKLENIKILINFDVIHTQA